MSKFPHLKIAAELADGDASSSAKRKGDSLESAICFALESLAGIEIIERNCLSATGSMEIDVVVHNRKSSAPSGVAFLENFMLVECKNWSSPVDSKSIRDFIGKLRTARLKEGILVAASGITGDAKEVSNAHDVLRQAFDKDGTKVLVITRKQLESFRETSDFIKVLRKRFTAHLLRQQLM